MNFEKSIPPTSSYLSKPDKSSELFFETSFGRKIKIYPGHFDFLHKTVGFRPNAANVESGKIKSKAKDLDHRPSPQQTSISLMGYVSRIVPTYQFIELLEQTRVLPSFERCLDVGCGRGIHPRILKGLGYTKEAIGLEIEDTCSMFNEKLIKARHKEFRRLKHIEKLQKKILRKPEEKRNTIENALLQSVWTAMTYGDLIGHRCSDKIYDLDLKHDYSLDRLIIGNLFELEEKFDLITSFASLDWFNSKTVFKKLSSLLTEGGILYVWVPCWWSPINTNMLFGHFPYAVQRLTQEDYFRYVRKFLPEYARSIEEIYSYFDANHPTLADYVEAAQENDFILLASKNNIRPHSVKKNLGITPVGYSSISDENVLKDVLDDIHCFRPDVRMTDLYTYSYCMLFQKKGPPLKLDPSTYEVFSKTVTPLPTPQGKSLKNRALRKALGWIQRYFFIGKEIN